MTRFARAKGSKASNEKAPEDATPWDVMKDQLLQAKKETEDAKNRHAAEQQRIENYENFLKERRVQKRPATWCDFPEAEQSSQTRTKVSAHNSNKVKKNKQNFENVNASQGSEVTESAGPSKKKKDKTSHKSNIPTDLNDNMNGDAIEYTEPIKKKKKKNQQVVSVSDEGTHEIVNGAAQTESKPLKKKKNKKKQASKQSRDENENNDNAKASYNPVQNSEENNFGKQKNNKKYKNNSRINQPDNENNTFSQKSESYINKNVNKLKAKKKKKPLDGQPVRRKEINDKSFQLIVGGKDVELIRYDGFPIMKKDAERLTELKNSMIKKGIPKSEVDRTMKLERRRAEKALARMRKEVCYNCRKGGHNLSDCPELKSKIPGADAPEGVCFKCGSTEHRQFECKVQRDKEFRFATCFICKEPGHIARQCPDNPKGLYPNGGSCKLCGDVTHLRKDCPTANNTKEETSVKLQTLDSTEDLEGIGAQNKSSTLPADTSKKPKKIRF
ncbi:hypothetical protein O0L34_g600 [Tuta absoluta]|nr:hypothetical protein O0L34_g600 [Tuta absoluta]